MAWMMSSKTNVKPYKRTCRTNASTWWIELFKTVFDFSCFQRLRGSKWNLAGGDVSLALHKGKNRTVTASQVWKTPCAGDFPPFDTWTTPRAPKFPPFVSASWQPYPDRRWANESARGNKWFSKMATYRLHSWLHGFEVATQWQSLLETDSSKDVDIQTLPLLDFLCWILGLFPCSFLFRF